MKAVKPKYVELPHVFKNMSKCAYDPVDCTVKVYGQDKYSALAYWYRLNKPYFSDYNTYFLVNRITSITESEFNYLKDLFSKERLEFLLTNQEDS